MSDETLEPTPRVRSLPERPNLEWLRTEAKRRLAELQGERPAAQLAQAQFQLAREYGFSSWRALKAHIDSLSIEAQLFDAAKAGDTRTLLELLDRHPDKLHARAKPGGKSLLHVGVDHLAVVDLLLSRGLDVNARERGDNTYAMHWAAARGRLDVVRRLADAGGDVIGRGDDHDLEVVGWATCWRDCNDEAHREVAAFLVSRGAKHHIFSAVAMNLESEVRRLVANDPSALNQRQSRNENNRTPLQFAVAMDRGQMVSLLLELGADPLAVDGAGQTVAAYAERPGPDQRVMEKIRAMTYAELLSAARGDRPRRGGPVDLVALLALDDWETAEQLCRDNPGLLDPAGGALHLMAKRNNPKAVAWLLAHGSDPNARWAHWDAEVTPLHLAASRGHGEVVRVLLDAGADPTQRDSKHGGDAVGWAEHSGHPAIVQMLREHHPS